MHRDAILSYGLSLSLDFSISSSPGEEIDFHDRLNFPGYGTYQQQRGFDPWNTFTFIRSNSEIKIDFFSPHRLSKICEYCSNIVQQLF